MATFGPLLRRTREQRGVTLDDVARETRLSKRYVVALEEEALGKLPGGTYNRAYLKIYATFLALEPEAILRDFLAEEERQIAASQQDLIETMNRAIDKRQATGADAGNRLPLPGWVLATAAATAVVAAIGGAGWYALDSGALGALEVEPAAVAVPRPEPAAPPAPAPEPAPAEPPAPASVPETVQASPSAAEPPADVTASAPAAPSAPATEPAPVTASSPTSAPPVVAAIEETHEADAPQAAASSHLSVSGSGVGTAVVDRQLVGQADRFAAGSRVVFWTHVVGGRAGDTIDHVWLRDGSVVGAASLSVGSPDWRTQSRRVVDPGGHWVVEARDADGRVLVRHEFQTSDQ